MYCAGVESLAVSAPPSFVRLAGHPLRWRLMSELARGDRRVRELVALLDQPQNLVSYHLRRLRAAGLVGARRSAFDARDAYYHLDLGNCAAALTGAGLALHPGLRLALAPAVPLERSCRVLFLCTGNSARSQMAEALLRHRAGDAVDVHSAGSQPKPLHPGAVRAMADRGIDISGASTKHLRRFTKVRFDHVITLCDRVREICPEFPGEPVTAHWSIPDPALAADASDAAFERTADELDDRIALLLSQLNPPQEGPHGRPDRQRALSRR